VTLTDGVQIGASPDAGEQVVERWREIGDRKGEIVPEHGFAQAERELAASGFTPQSIAASR
jgi:hypothetical protein